MLNKKRLSLQDLLSLLLFLRFAVPFLIFFNPLLALGVSVLLDSFDGQLFYTLGYPWSVYNRADKTLDLWWYLFILFFLRGTAIFPLELGLLLYRGIGQLTSMILNNERIYLFFPNLIEAVFLIYLLRPATPILVIFLVSLVWALLVEWSIHLSNLHFASQYLFHNKIRWERNV